MRHLPTLLTLIGFAWIGLVQAAVPVLPPSFIKPVRSLYSSREEMWFQVRIVPHASIRTLRVELWELAEVPWSATFPFEGSTETVSDAVRYEPRDCIRSSDEPLEHMMDPSVKPRTIYPIRWMPVTRGKYEIRAKVITSKKTSVSATRRIQVM